MIEWAVDRPGLRLGIGDCADYEGDADLVFSHLYGPLPKQLIGKLAIINVFGDRKAKAEEWCGAALIEVSKWGRDLRNTIYVANMVDRDGQIGCSTWDASPPDLTRFVEDEYAPGRGWFPAPMCAKLLRFYSFGFLKGRTVVDGFMGRGTVGKAARELGMNFVGIDRDHARVALAGEYLGC